MTPRTAAILLALTLAGCERPHSDMGQQDKYLPGQATSFFPDGKAARPLPAGVIPRDDADVPGYPYALHITDTTDFAATNATVPFPITADILAHGQQQFETYCAVCHGRLGNGQGMIVQRGFTRPPSFHIDRLRTIPDSHLYNVITHGYGAMFSYAERIPPQQRWEIIAYIRALQMAPDVVGTSLPSTDRQALIAGGDRQTPGPAGGGG